MHERRQDVYRLSSYAIVFLSVIALLTVLTGYGEPPQSDEGTAAHVFQLSVVMLAPMTLLFLATADWRQPLRSVRPLLLSAVTLVLAFGALYYLEHYRNPNYVGSRIWKSKAQAKGLLYKELSRADYEARYSPPHD